LLGVNKTGSCLHPVGLKACNGSTNHRNIVLLPVISEEGFVDLVFHFTLMFEKVLDNSGALKEQEDVVMVVGHVAVIFLGVLPLLNTGSVLLSMNVFGVYTVVLDIRLAQVPLE
jgi:hypothetical protein